MSERASKSPRAQEARHPNPACPKDEASNLPLAGGTGRSKACTRETRRAPPRFARDRVNPCYFVVLRSEIGSFDEIAWIRPGKLGAHSYESLRNRRSHSRFAPARLSRPCYFVDACISRAQTHEIAWIPSKAPLRNTSKIASLRRARARAAGLTCGEADTRSVRQALTACAARLPMPSWTRSSRPSS